MDDNLARVVEAYKARVTVGLALLLGVVTITGYALSTESYVLLLIAACIPVIAFVCDFAILYGIACPFAYKFFVVDEGCNDIESLGYLCLAYGSVERSEFYRNKICSMEPGIQRQKKFRSFFIRKGIYSALVFFGLVSAVELVLWVILK